MASHKAPLTRVQAKRRARLQRRIALIPLFCLFAAFMLAVMVNGTMREAYGVNDAAPVARASVDDLESTSVSRSSARSEINHGTWESDDDIDPSRLGAIPAQNPVVYRLVNGRDRDQTPDGFDPDHADGDTGNAYSFSQCTWWAYKRRHELNLPAGSHMGDGAMWADSARKLGYWVDHTPRVGDVMVFQRGQNGASLIYGHVAVVEQVHADGSITTSECGAALGGKPFSRTFTKTQAAQHEYVHY